MGWDSGGRRGAGSFGAQRGNSTFSLIIGSLSPTLLGQDHGKSLFMKGQVLFLSSDPQAWCRSPGRILQS